MPEKVKVKICGITNLIDAKNAINLGADYIGFVNLEFSPRYISIEEIRSLISDFTEEEKQKLVLLTDKNTVDAIINLSSKLYIKSIQPYANLTTKDLYSLKSLGFSVFKPVQVHSADDIEDLAQYQSCADVLILDSKSSSSGALGGTGETFDWKIFEQAKEANPRIKLALAGGLNPENIMVAIKQCQPYMVDISSGLESQVGIKSLDKMKALFATMGGAAKEAFSYE